MRARSGGRTLLLAAMLLTDVASSKRPPMDEADSPGIAGNPGAVDVQPGTGALGRLLGLDPSTGFRLGGVLVSNGNYLLSGGNNPGRASFNNLLVIDLGVDLDKAAGIPGAKVGAALLRFDGQPTNQQAGVATGYNGLPGAPPLHRTELYELWWRQSFLDDKLVVRFGKTVPTNDFGNVVRPVPVQDVSLQIPAVSSLIYTPIFENPTILGALPGYYNSAYGITATITPSKRFYVSLGTYDGNGARGEQTGLREAPTFTAIGSISVRSAPPGCSGRTACQEHSASEPGTRPGGSPWQRRNERSRRTEPTAPTRSPRSGCGAARATAMRKACRGSRNSALTTRAR